MKLPDSLRIIVLERLRHAREHHPASLSEDGTAVLIDGGIGYGAYLSPDGDAFLETYDIANESESKIDRSARGQCMALVLGTRTCPELATLLPQRHDGASDCGACGASGWRIMSPDVRIICAACTGLGWLGTNGDHDGVGEEA